jgi:RES domain-containing protein
MKLYRIALKAYADLEGTGGIFSLGRWHHEGHRVVYLSQNVSLAAWEKLINLASTTLIPSDLVLIEVSVPDVKLLEVPEDILTKGWDGFPYLDLTMEYGTKFLTDNEYLLLKVPSAVIKEEYNYLLNPKHPLISQCKIEQVTPFLFDSRISK